MAYTGKKVEEKQPFVLVFRGIEETVSIQLNACLNFVYYSISVVRYISPWLNIRKGILQSFLFSFFK